MKRPKMGPRCLFYTFLLISLCVPVGHAQESKQESKRKIVKKEDVVYPAVLKSKGIGGTVQLRVTVKPDGGVKKIDLLGGSAALADAATESVRRWRFEPASTETETTVVVKFDPKM
jgi:TonB family protein